MAKFRKNHDRGKNPFIGLTIRVVLMLLIICLLFFLTYRSLSPEVSQNSGQWNSSAQLVERDYLPENKDDEQIVHHNFYSLAYNEKYELAEWVSYILIKDELRIPNVERNRNYLIDPLVESQSAHYRDYKGSGYTRGHLAPAGDMAFSKKAMKESFFMSNISPQKRSFNNGIWKELEETVRDWAFKEESLYIVTGPVLNDIDHYIGSNNVGVPKSFYKVVLDLNSPEEKGIAFVIPNELSTRPLRDYAMSIDQLESLTGNNFYDRLMEDSEEEKIESDIDINLWDFSNKRYKLRIEEWNKE